MVTDLCCSDLIVAAVCGNYSSEAGEPCFVVALFSYQDARTSGNTALSSPCWSVNPHASSGYLPQFIGWAIAGFPGFAAGRGYDPTGGAPGGG
ncbi:hypothetical protein F511_15827 [Dorcoceras hygrometricum]|uniref:Uncharacterized protein n=1 Tax=Dorcoceras hygrometricum TaxID=472368 RepID=A0A2Z7D237_9LAMI|nr:hypothetical protein F511_15827 [Dorcoceras hygrometricum]